MKNDDESAGCGYAMIGMAVAIACIPYFGYVTVRLWDWFVLPLFPMLPALNIIKAIGLRLTWQWFCPSRINWNEDDKVSPETKLGRSLCHTVLYPTFALTLGYIYHKCTT